MNTNEDRRLLLKLMNRGRENLDRCFEKTFDELYEDKVIEARTSLDKVKEDST
jgi:hypothetical protein